MFTAVVCRLSLSVVASLGVGRARSRVAVCSIVQVAYVFASVFRAGRQDAKQRVPPVNDQRRWSARSPASPRPASDSSGSRGRCPVLAGLDRRWGGGGGARAFKVGAATRTPPHGTCQCRHRWRVEGQGRQRGKSAMQRDTFFGRTGSVAPIFRGWGLDCGGSGTPGMLFCIMNSRRRRLPRKRFPPATAAASAHRTRACLRRPLFPKAPSPPPCRRCQWRIRREDKDCDPRSCPPPGRKAPRGGVALARIATLPGHGVYKSNMGVAVSRLLHLVESSPPAAPLGDIKVDDNR